MRSSRSATTWTVVAMAADSSPGAASGVVEATVTVLVIVTDKVALSTSAVMV